MYCFYALFAKSARACVLFLLLFHVFARFFTFSASLFRTQAHRDAGRCDTLRAYSTRFDQSNSGVTGDSSRSVKFSHPPIPCRVQIFENPPKSSTLCIRFLLCVRCLYIFICFARFQGPASSKKRGGGKRRGDRILAPANRVEWISSPSHCTVRTVLVYGATSI